MATTATLVNGQPSDKLPVEDRGLQYGDGVFRTLLLHNSQVLDLDLQLTRLEQDAAQLALDAPAASIWMRDISRLTAGHSEAVIKLILTRGSGPRGYRADAAAFGTRIVMRHPLATYPVEYWEEGIEAGVCRTRMGHNPALAGIKHLNRLEQVIARSEPDIKTEGLMLDQNGNVISGTMSNLFVVSESELLTPQLQNCGVKGVMRQKIMQIAGSEAIPVREVALSLQACLEADECFLSNSLIGIWPLRQLNTRSWQPGPVTRQLQTKLEHPRISTTS